MVPDLAEPIEAWRCWSVEPGWDPSRPLLLHSPALMTMWPPARDRESYVFRGEQRHYITARCAVSSNTLKGLEEHDCPSALGVGHSGKGCGIYGYKTVADLAWDFPCGALLKYRSHLGRIAAQVDASTLIWGKVLLWGNVYEHERGYRAQYAQVKELVWVEGSTPKFMVKQCADFYGIEAVALPPSIVAEIERDHSRRLQQGFGPLVSIASDILLAAQGAITQTVEAFRSLADAIENWRNDG